MAKKQDNKNDNVEIKNASMVAEINKNHHFFNSYLYFYNGEFIEMLAQ